LIIEDRHGDGGGGARPLVESALLAAITVLLMFLGAYLPIAGILVILIWPIPVMVVILRHGLRYGLMTVGVIAMLTAMFMGILQALFAGVAIVGFIGVAFGLGLQRHWSAGTMIGAGTGVVAAAFLVAILITGPLMGVNLVDQIQFAMVESIERAADIYIGMGMDPDAVEETRQQMRDSLEFLQMVFPAVFMMAALMYASWTYLMTRWIVPRLGYEVPPMPSFATWKAPKWMAPLLLGAFLAEVLLAAQPDSFMRELSGNVLFATNMGYLLFGVALLYYFVRRVVSSRWLSGLLCAVLTFNSLMLLLLPLAAILDSGLDFRGRMGSGAAG